MTTDMEYGSDRDLIIDETGDIATVVGDDRMLQQHDSAIVRAFDQGGIADVEGAYTYGERAQSELLAIPGVEEVEFLSVEEDGDEYIVNVRTNVTETSVTI